ncbi:uncharacterized protein LOC100877251 [Megachile rotundata]|uniref:uncharacterized protein LOC100877251 n=1 Tax=Megachile rotundata TaxID=143995 RepID=UPI000258E810|nr:PREDICTED: uncharacterized protein LOC100877251 [Megachile rotundata]
MKLILLVTLLAVLYTIDFSNSAAVRTEEFAEQLRRIVHDMHLDKTRTQRGTDENDDEPKRDCYDTPCGWNTYTPSTRLGTIFMRNTCKCPDETYKCVRTGENVSMSAYVYHCRQNTTADDIESESSDDMDYVS